MNKSLVNYTDGNFDDVCRSISYTSTYGLSEFRAIIVGGDGERAFLANDCSDSSFQDINDELVHRLPGELQEVPLTRLSGCMSSMCMDCIRRKKLAFWQKGTCVSFDFSDAPGEQSEQLNYCESIGVQVMQS